MIGEGGAGKPKIRLRMTKTDPAPILIRWNEWAPAALFHTKPA